MMTSLGVSGCVYVNTRDNYVCVSTYVCTHVCVILVSVCVCLCGCFLVMVIVGGWVLFWRLFCNAVQQ